MLLMRAWFTATVLTVFAAFYVWSWLTVPPAVVAKKRAKVAGAREPLEAAQGVIDELEPAARDRVARAQSLNSAISRRLRHSGAERWEDEVAEILERKT